MSRAAVLSVIALALSGCNLLAGIDAPRLDPCVDDPGGGCQALSGSGGGGSDGASATATSAMSSSSTGPAAPVCGNGVVEPGEQCDDGNTTNGDGCSATCQVECTGPGLYEDPTTFHCYRYVMMMAAWGDARDACIGAGEHLATFTSASELDAVAPHAPGQLWIDGERSGPGFIWDDGEPWSFERWMGMGPESDPNKDCVKLDMGFFDVDNCMAAMPYLCERDPAGR